MTRLQRESFRRSIKIYKRKHFKSLDLNIRKIKMTQEQRIINKEREKMRLEKLVGKKNKNRGSKDDEKN